MVSKKINLYEPFLPEDVYKIVNKYIRKNEISTYGSAINLLEDKLSNITKSKFNLATSSGSSALCVALKSAGLKKNELVLTQSYTFIATINSIFHAGGEPVLLDISEDNLSLNINSINNFIKEKCFIKERNIYLKKKNRRVSAICAVISFAITPNLDDLLKLKNKYNIKIILDAACALGCKFKNYPLTNFCDAVIYSFNGNKTFTTGGGGLITTNNFKIFKESKLLITNGKSSRYEYSRISYNYRMTNLHAAIGLSQLKNFNKILKKKEIISSTYIKSFKNLPVHFLPHSKYEKTIHWINFLVLKNDKQADNLIKFLNKKNIDSYLFWKPIHLQKLNYNIEKHKLKFTNFIWKKIVPLPSHPNLSKKELDYIIKKVKHFFNE